MDERRVRARDLMATFEADGAVLLRSASRGLGLRLPPWLLAVVAACNVPRTRAEIVAEMGPQGGQGFDVLVRTGALLPPDEAADTPVMFGNFAGVPVHRRMLADEARIGAYRRALAATVRPGDVVIDAGAGTGVLAVLAALAGARKVYAIERTEFARVAEQVAADSGVADRVTVIRGDFSTVQLPERARVLVTETVGAWVLAEGAQPDLRALAANHLVEDAVVIPSAFSLWVAPLAVAPPDLVAPFRRRADGVDLSCLAAEARGRAQLARVDAAAVGAAAFVGRFPLLCDPVEGLHAEVALDGPCEALCAWFTLHLAEGIDLPTGPADPPTHWKQTVLPVALPAGRHTLRLGLRLAPEDRRSLLVTVERDGAPAADVRVR